MQVEVEDEVVACRVEIRDHIEQRAFTELAVYGGYVNQVRLRLTEGRSLRHRYHCGIALTIAHDDGGQTNVGTAANGNDLVGLIDSVFADASSLAGEEIARGLRAQEEAGVAFSHHRVARA